jgi:hypothetical protein
MAVEVWPARYRYPTVYPHLQANGRRSDRAEARRSCSSCQPSLPCPSPRCCRRSLWYLSGGTAVTTTVGAKECWESLPKEAMLLVLLAGPAFGLACGSIWVLHAEGREGETGWGPLTGIVCAGRRRFHGLVSPDASTVARRTRTGGDV